MRCLVRWNSFTVEYNIQEKEMDLENAKTVAKFEGRLNIEVKRQKRINKRR